MPVYPIKDLSNYKAVIGGRVSTISRYQLPILPAYAFTIEKCQGQNIPKTIVDIASTPHGSVTLEHLYVAFTRSRGRDGVRILRGFPEKIADKFRNHSSQALRKYDAQLRREAVETRTRFTAGTLFNVLL